MHPHDESAHEPELLAENIAEEDYEEISSDEVDRVVQALETLIGETRSENIRAYLDEAAENIYRLVYDEEADWSDDVAEAA